MDDKKRERQEQMLLLYWKRAALPGCVMVEKKEPAGACLISQGGSPEKLFLVLEGRLKTYLTTPKGNDYLVAVPGPGELLGEVEILTGEPHTCFVTAMEDTRVAVLSGADYKRWLMEDSMFSLLVNRMLCERVQEASVRMAMHMSFPLEYSVLKLLSGFSRGKGTRSLTKADMADYLGTSQRSINRILKSMQERGVVSCDSSGISVVSQIRLQEQLLKHEK